METVRELKLGEKGKYFATATLTETFKSDKYNKITVDSEGFIHSINDKVAYVEYHDKEHTKISYMFWFNHGIEDRLTGPYFIDYDESGTIIVGKYYSIKGKQLTKQEFEIEINRINMLNEIE